VVFDVDDFEEVDNLALHDYIGELEFTLNDVMCSPTKVVTREFYNPKKLNLKKKLGTCEVRGTFYDVDGKKIYFHLGAKDFLKTHELYLRVNCLS
jgi:hypothetical protein